jgi:hypothetical protein
VDVREQAVYGRNLMHTWGGLNKRGIVAWANGNPIAGAAITQSSDNGIDQSKLAVHRNQRPWLAATSMLRTDWASRSSTPFTYL